MGLLEIQGQAFDLQFLPLKNVRPLVVEKIELSETKIEPENFNELQNYAVQKIEEMIEKAQSKSKQMIIPLIRLKIEHTGYPTTPFQQIGKQFKNKVANHREIIQFYRKQAQLETNLKREDNEMDQEEEKQYFREKIGIKEDNTLKQLIQQNCSNLETKILTTEEILKAFDFVVQGSNAKAFEQLIEVAINETTFLLMEQPDEEITLDTLKEVKRNPVTIGESKAGKRKKHNNNENVTEDGMSLNETGKINETKRKKMKVEFQEFQETIPPSLPIQFEGNLPCEFVLGPTGDIKNIGVNKYKDKKSLK